GFVKRYEKGEDIWKKTTTFGLVDDGVGYVDNDFFKQNVPEALRNEMAKAFDDAKSGKLKVKSYFDFASDKEYEAYLESAR
ncbi:MAG: hypothetical protein II704_04035, partial [Erysipelotrichaceae bacterium]|nr:hypothetical protein [Erysipelotrichaceae bacterium]